MASSSSDNGSRSSSSAADSYIGSLISLTSKSEIRYEGVLYNINTDESSIGLRNVRSFGTEGRKKDGPQIPPGDKVYEYILFRGTDIKDLQVKSSPPVLPTPPVNTDPAIIQSQYSRPVTTTSSLPAVSGPLIGHGSHDASLGLHGSNFQTPLPLYQPGGSWGASLSAPNANGGGLAMPMYWQGYYGAPNGLPQLQQQSLFRPPPGLSMPSPMQQPMQFPNFNPSLPTGPSHLPDIPASLLPVSTSSPSVSNPVPPSNLPLTLPPAPSASLASEPLPVPVPNKAPTGSLSAVSVSSNLQLLTPFSNGGPAIGDVVPSVNKPNAISGTSLPYQTVPQLDPATVGSSNSIQTETPAPSLVTPGQLLQSGPALVSSQPLQTPHKDVEVIQVSSRLPSEASVPVSAETQPPILPLPVNSRPKHRPNGAPTQTHHGYNYRGRGRGAGGMRPVARFTEDFDFMAMNEKFNKDEVWGHLGKSQNSKDKDGEEIVSDEDGIQDDGDGDVLKLDAKPVYNKDDFFDSLSSNALDRESQNGRIRYSEQIKMDTETFGEFSRHRGGGRGPWRGGRGRGGYYGRGYGYGGRGRGRGGRG